MTYASISIDRREAYYQRCATHIAADPLGFYTRAEIGRRLQGSIKRGDLAPFYALEEAAPKRSLRLAWSSDTHGHTRAA